MADNRSNTRGPQSSEFDSGAATTGSADISPTRDATNSRRSSPPCDRITGTGQLENSTTGTTSMKGTLHDHLLSVLTDLSRPSPTPRDLSAGLSSLYIFLDQSELVTHPLHHAIVHASIAINTPLSVTNNCAAKSHHFQKAEENLYTIKKKGHHGGEKCQGCVLLQIQKENGRDVDRGDGSECNCIARLDGVIEKERRRIGEFNWNNGTFVGWGGC